MGALIASFERESGSVAAGATGSLTLASSFVPDPGATVLAWFVSGNASFVPTGPPPTTGGITWRQLVASAVSATTTIYCWAGTAPDAPSATNPSVPYRNGASSAGGAHLVVQEFGGVTIPGTANTAVVGPITTSTTGGATGTITPTSDDSMIAWVGADFNGVISGSPTPSGGAADVLSQSYLFSSAGVLADWAYSRALVNRGARTFGFSSFSSSATRKIMLAAVELPTTPTGAKAHRLLADDPSTANYTDSTGRSQGLAFTVDEAGWITRIWWRRSSGNAWPTAATIWQDTSATAGTAISSGVTWPADTTLTGWVPGILTTPVYVVPGQAYRATVTAVGQLPGTTNYWTSGAGGSGRRSGPLRAPSRANAPGNAQGCYASGSSPAFPATASAGTNYGVDISFEADPDFIQGENECTNPEAVSGGSSWGVSGPTGVAGGYVTGLSGYPATTGYRLTNGSTAGNCWLQAPMRDPGRDMSGETWSVALSAAVSAAVSCSVQLYPYDSAGTNLGTITGPSITPVAGAVTRFTVAGVLPAGTVRVREVLLARTLPASGTITGTGARYRRGSWSDLPPRDGSDLKWEWLSTAHASVSRRVPRVWGAGTDGAVASTTGLEIGFEGTQVQTTADSGPVNTATGVPVEAAPGGRPGRAAVHALAADGVRIEHNPWHREFVAGDDYWFGFSFYLDADYPLDLDDFQVLEQLHGAPETGSPVVAFEARNGQLRVTGGANRPGASSAGQYAYDRVLVSALQRQRWYSVRYRAPMSETPGGAQCTAVVQDDAGTTLITDTFTPPCGTVYGRAEFPSTGGPTYRKSGYYKRGSAGRAGTVRLAGHALGTDYASADPHRQLAFVVHQGIASAVSGTRALAAALGETFGGASATSGTRAEAGPTVLADAGAATARSGTRALGDAPRTTFGAAPATSGSRALLAPSTPAAGQAVSATRAEAAPTVTGAVAAEAVSGTVVPGPGVAVNPPLALAAVSGSRTALAATLDAAAAGAAVSATRALADGVRQLFSRDGAAAAVSGSRVEGGVLGTLLAAGQAISATRAEAGPFQTVPGVAVAVSATRVGGTILGTERAISGTVAVAGPRQTVMVAAAVVSATRGELGVPTAETFGAAAARSGTVVALAGVVSGLAGPASTRSGTRARAGADPTIKVAAAVVVSGTVAAADRPQLGQFGELAAVSATIVIGTAAPPFRPTFVLPVGPSRPLVAAPQRRVYLVETMTGRVLWTMPHTTLSWSSPLNAIGDCSTTLVVPDALDALAGVDPVTGRRAQDPRATLRGFLLGPWRFSVVPCWGATPLMGGPMLPSDDVVGGKVAVKGVGMERMLEKRVVIQAGTGTYTDPSRDVSLPSTTPGRAVHQLVSRAIVGAARGLPIVCTRPPAAAGTEDFTWPSYDLTKVWKAVSDLTARVDGPDVRLEPMPLRERDDGIYVSWNLEIGDPFLPASGNPGPAGPLPWTFSPPASSVSRTIDPAGMATRYWATGDGQERAKVVATADATYLTNVLGFPSLEEVDAATGGTDDNQRSGDLGGAQARANALRDAHQRPGDTWKVTLPMDGSPDLSLVRRGDLGRLEVRDKLYIDDGYYHRRITKIEGGDGPTATLSFDDDGADSLMTMGV